jgi:transcriptional regulator with XRE-family HTH domain
MKVRKSGRTDVRKHANLTLHQLAARTGISRSRLSLWENYAAHLRDSEIALVAAALIEGLDRTPKFGSDQEIETFLEGDK